jgi:NAD(P)-dependent dehydrogenase (short-subunit alcohol dehydrogenase family)
VVRVNLKSMFLATKAALPHMVRQFAARGGAAKRARGGAIVNIGSIAGIRWTGVPYVAYSTTKGAVIPFTRSIALQYAAQGIRCNAILPGLMNTPMIVAPLTDAYGAGGVAGMIAARDAQCPMGFMGDAWDVAHAALFLASDEARYVTGVALPVDGGITGKFA